MISGLMPRRSVAPALGVVDLPIEMGQVGTRPRRLTKPVRPVAPGKGWQPVRERAGTCMPQSSTCVAVVAAACGAALPAAVSTTLRQHVHDVTSGSVSHSASAAPAVTTGQPVACARLRRCSDMPGFVLSMLATPPLCCPQSRPLTVAKTRAKRVFLRCRGACAAACTRFWKLVKPRSLGPDEPQMNLDNLSRSSGFELQCLVGT